MYGKPAYHVNGLYAELKIPVNSEQTQVSLLSFCLSLQSDFRMCTAISVDIHLFRNEQRLGSEEAEHGGGGVGESIGLGRFRILRGQGFEY